jgi:hypothetical protein
MLMESEDVVQVVLGTLLAALVPVVGFNAVMTSEHFASFLVREIFQLVLALLIFMDLSFFDIHCCRVRMIAWKYIYILNSSLFLNFYGRCLSS